jgi:hypothetical protein
MSDKVVGLEPVGHYSGKEGEYGYDIVQLYEDIPEGTNLYSESQVAALQAELAEANDSLTVAYMAGAASKLDEIPGLQAELSKCKRDAERLRYLFESSGIEGFVHVELDLYDYALQIADERGHDEPTVDDDFDGFRRLIDAAMKEGK